jgi:hypothetical protein
MADPTGKIKTQKDLILDQNDLLKDQVSILREIEKLTETRISANSELQSSIKKHVASIDHEHDVSERINKIKEFDRSIVKETTELERRGVEMRAKLDSLRMGGILSHEQAMANSSYERLHGEWKSINAQLKELEKIAQINSSLIPQNQKIAKLSQIISGFNKSSLLSSIGLGQHSQWLKTTIQNIVILGGRNVGWTNNMLSILQKWEGPLLVAMVLLKKTFEIFKSLDAAAWIARKEMGMMRDTHVDLRKQAELLVKEYAHLGVTAEMAYKTQRAISLELGSSLLATKDIVTQASLMSAQFGISEETTVRMLKTLAQVGQTVAGDQTKMVGFAAAMSNAAGVPLPQVMDDIAKSSETTRSMIGKLPLDLIKSAVEARRMGTTLDKMTASSRKLLNFTESIEAEMESSVLMGRSINLQLARQLAYNGKIVESNNEILRITKQVNFDNMDVFQMEAFARATGKSVDELKSMLQASREQEKMRISALTDKSLAKKLAGLDELRKANEAAAKIRGENYNLSVKERANQERMTAISQNWNALMTKLAYRILPIIDATLGFVVDHFNKIVAVLVPTILFATQLSKVFTKMGASMRFTGVANNWKWASHLGKTFLQFGTTLSTVGARLKPIFTILGTGGKAIPIIGEIIMLIQGVWSAGKRLVNLFSLLFDGKWADAFKAGVALVPGIVWDVIGKSILELIGWIAGLFNDNWADIGDRMIVGVENGVSGIYDAIAGLVGDIWKQFKSLIGFSPSELGLSILDGLTSIFPLLLKSIHSFASAIFSAIMSPFKSAVAAISDVMSTLFSKNKIQPAIVTPIVEQKIASLTVPVSEAVSEKQIQSYRELNAADASLTSNKIPAKDSVERTAVDMKSETADLFNKALLSEIKGLREDLLSGKIAVNMDGQLVSATMNRNNSFRKNYGSIAG